MAFKYNEMGQLVRDRPREAAKKICEALEARSGAIAPTAAFFGVDGATLRRWIDRLRAEKLKIEPVRSAGRPWHRPAPKKRKGAKKRSKSWRSPWPLDGKKRRRKKELAMRA